MKYKPTALKTMQKSNKDFKRNLSAIPNNTKSEYKPTAHDKKRERDIELFLAENHIDWQPLFMRGVTNE